jgi:phage shock protein A
MGSMFDRFSNLFKVKLNSALDAAEDPGEMLEYSYEKLLQYQQEVRRGIADVATARVRLQQQLAQVQAQESHLESQARQALTLDREDLARTALTRKNDLATQRQTLTGQLENLESQQAKLLEGEQRLASRIMAFKAHKEAIKASYAAAQAQVQLNEAMTGLSQEMGDLQVMIERAHNKVQNMQARATALDELAGGASLPQIGPGADDIDRELARLSESDRIERQLSTMKRELLAEPEPPRQITAGDTSTSGQASAERSGQVGEPQSAPEDDAGPWVPPHISDEPATPADYTQGGASPE